MKLSDIPQFTRSAPYSVTIFWSKLERFLAEEVAQGLDLDPDFQRGHVWTEAQQVAFVEFILRGGESGKDILTNQIDWHHGKGGGVYVLVDGKQRLTAVLRFLRNEIRAFGHLYSEFEDRKGVDLKLAFRYHINDLKTRAEVLQWYLDLNAGGTPHSSEEISRVRGLLAAESK